VDVAGLIGALGGFVIPGWLGAVLLRVSCRSCAALILGTLALFWSIMLTGALGLPLRFGTVLGTQVFVAVAMASLIFRRRFRPSTGGSLPVDSFSELPDLDIPTRALAIPIGAVCGVFVMRYWIQPLVGFDCPVRWNLLADNILRFKSLDFYPPVTSGDFRV